MRYFLISIFLCMQLHSSGQELEWSNARKLKGNAIFTYVVGQADQGIYLLRYRNRFFSKQIILERYRDQLGFANARSFKLSKSRLIQAELMNDRIILFFSTYDRINSRNTLSVRSFDENLQETGSFTELCHSPLADYYDKGDFRMQFSRDKRTVLVSNSLGSGAAKSMVLRTYNTETWGLTDSILLNLAVNGPVNRIDQIDFDNGKDAYLIHEWKEKSNRRVGLDYNHFTLIHACPEQGEAFRIELGDSSTFIQQPRISVDRQRGSVFVTAFYSQLNPSTFNGFFRQTYIPGRKSGEFRIHPFDVELKRTLITDKGKRPDEELQDMALLKVLPNLDGGVTIVTEMASITSEEDIVNVNGVPQAMSRNIYNFGDILVMSLDSGFEERWHHVISKNQSSMNDGGYYSSAIVANTRSHIYIIYNDQMRNNGDVLQYTVDNEGKLSHKILLRSSENYVSVIPGEASQIAYNKLLLPVNRDRRFALLKLTYPN